MWNTLLNTHIKFVDKIEKNSKQVALHNIVWTDILTVVAINCQHYLKFSQNNCLCEYTPHLFTFKLPKLELRSDSWQCKIELVHSLAGIGKVHHGYIRTVRASECWMTLHHRACIQIWISFLQL